MKKDKSHFEKYAIYKLYEVFPTTISINLFFYLNFKFGFIASYNVHLFSHSHFFSLFLSIFAKMSISFDSDETNDLSTVNRQFVLFHVRFEWIRSIDDVRCVCVHLYYIDEYFICTG